MRERYKLKKILVDLPCILFIMTFTIDHILITPQENIKLNQQLRQAIKRQNQIIDLSVQFRELSQWIIFGHFLSASLTICYGGLAFMLAPGIPAKLRYIIYLSCILLELWCYCLGASILEEQSFKVAESAYFGYWYKTNNETRRLINIIIMRSQKAVILKVPFFTPSLPAFTSVSWLVVLQGFGYHYLFSDLSDSWILYDLIENVYVISYFSFILHIVSTYDELL